MKTDILRYVLMGFFVLALRPALAQTDSAAAPAPQASVTLPEVTVDAAPATGLTTQSAAAARKDLTRIPGGTSLVESGDFRQGKADNLQDVLSFAPGVFVQSRFGGSETRVSIRGSGINLTYGERGVLMLRDGLPLNFADGFLNTEMISPLTARYVEVYRGANALERGAATLGGAVNFVSPTGYTAPPLQTRLDVGSDGYVRPQISGGALLDEHWDAYGSLSGLRYDGFRDQSKDTAWRGYANVGYRHGDNAETRVYFNMQNSDLHLPGSLTWQQLQTDPTQANAGYAASNSLRLIKLQRVAIRHTRRSDAPSGESGAGDQLDIGAYYQHFDLANHRLPYFELYGERNDAGASLRQTLLRDVAGLDNRFIWGARFGYGDNHPEHYAPAGLGRGPLTQKDTQRALTTVLFAEDQIQLSERLTLVPGAQATYARRETSSEFGSGPDISAGYTGFNPKLGLLWQATPALQWFGNVSRSFEPPTLDELSNPVTGSLDAQTATTLEMGVRGRRPLLSWEIDVYHSWVDDEILTTETPPASGNYVTNNADDTRHFGIEFGLDGRLPLGRLAPGDLRLRASYTYSRFRFVNDPGFANNAIPGIPEHFGRLELLYEHPSGIYFGPSLEAANAYYVDFANTLKTRGYAIYGVRSGYDNASGLSIYVEVRNLADKRYAANTNLIANAAGRDAAVFNPGLTRSVFAGADFSW